jgi:hypothetical protein
MSMVGSKIGCRMDHKVCPGIGKGAKNQVSTCFKKDGWTTSYHRINSNTT